MAIPSDPDYKPYATEEKVLASPFYRELLSQDIDPYAPHSYNEQLIQMVEEFASR